MKKIFFLPLLLSFMMNNINAQTSNIGQVAKTVYVNQKMPIIFNTGCTAGNQLNYEVSNGRIEQQGNTIFLIPNQKGKVTVKVFDKNKLMATSAFMAKDLPPFKVTLGDNDSKRISGEIMRKENRLKLIIPDFLNEEDYEIVSATVYFSGTGFEDVAVATLVSNSLTPIQSILEKCGPGSVITFDNIKVQSPNGIMYSDGLGIALY